MTPTEMVLICALELLGRSREHLPRIAIVASAPEMATPGAAAFVVPDKRVIFLISSSPAFQTASSFQTSSHECRGRDALLLVSSMIAHELWHVRHGPNEEGAYAAQLMELRRLGVDSDGWQYRSVVEGRAAARKARRGRE